MKGKREIVAETFEPDEPCDCECKMLKTIQQLVLSTKGQDDILENLRDLAVLQRERIHYLDNRITLLELAMRGMDYDEEECECGCSG